MKFNRAIYILIYAGIALVTGACSNTKFLKGDQLLYTGRKAVIIADSGKIKDNRIKPLVESATAFSPNNSIGGKRLLLPVGLWTYNYLKPKIDKKPGIIYRSFAKEPVLITSVNPEARSQKLESELFGIGYFHSSVRSEIKISKKNPRKAGITYFVRPGKPFIYNDISFDQPENEVDSLITGYEPDLSIKPGDYFDLDKTRSVGRDITSRLLESGYFYFSQNNITYTADTVNIPFRIDLRIGKNTESSLLSEKKYFIDSITVLISGETDSAVIRHEIYNAESDGIRIISTGSRFSPEVFTRAVYFRKGDVYSASGHRQTIIHLNSYGVFKFINIRYNPDPDTIVNKLDVVIELTPMKDISLDLEANVVTKSTGFSGPGFAATLAHGNLWGGANKLQLRLTGGFEWQWSGSSNSGLGQFSYNAGISSSITFPKIITPFGLFNTQRFNLPQTSVSLGFEFLNKIQYYRMSSINLGFGYRWKKPEKITHSYSPVFINSINLLETTSEFDSILMDNPYIKKSFEEQFIVGMKYDFIFDNSLNKPPHGFYFQTGINTSGNLLDLVKSRSSGEAERPYKFLGNAYSQFLKVTADIRYYRNFRDKSLAFRFYSGIGLPYSNSVVMPYVEQFYSGGSNSIRAFIARSVGPGSLPPPEESDIIDQTGDIRLEGNMEFRFRITKIVHGALFIDAGNVWLLNPDELRPGAEFRFDTFASQLAIGSGVGIRFDFDFFVLRTDFGFPVRTPYQINGTNWLRKTDKMVFNFAIGYPF